ncbi:GNAT family N-acetyltransferase [Tissierella sp. Yu-01]|uniref:GNAT family N-acetyltransferase n=1 Tax=Tissierella sp. Yu-01 TaxID=3035694 RepID=UPI00240D927B|nr:GNAT family N-acetyltransferase [Tissierella sp. Yu-01]WFA08364.1 GNAT family N-acetyltransferase [Tissierella sp. Yu-01]
MEIKGPRITIRPLKLEDVFLMRGWGTHDNPLIADYNFPDLSDKDIERWHRKKTSSFKNKYYGIYNEEEKFIGYMGIKNIKRFKRESTLGLVFDPSYVSKRYGTETLDTFLNYYFTQMNMRRMFLEVAEFNERAYKLYINMGFKKEGYYLDYFFDQDLDLSNPYFLKEQSSFVINNKKIYNYIYRMRLEKEDFFARIRS